MRGICGSCLSPPGRAEQEMERPGLKNRLQCVSAHPSASRAFVYPSVKWVDGPCLGLEAWRQRRCENARRGSQREILGTGSGERLVTSDLCRRL